MTQLKKHPADDLTPVQRRTRIAQGLSFDRMPVNLFMPDIKARMLDCPIRDLYLDADTIVQAEVEAYNRYGSDWLFIGPNSKGIAQALGADISYPENAMPFIASYVLSDYKDLDNYTVQSPKSHPRLAFFYQVARDLAFQADGVVNLSVSLGGPLTIASYLRGTEQVLRDLRRQPENLHNLLRIIVETQKAIIRSYADLPAIHFSLADPVASGSLLAPQYFEAFVLPYLQELAQTVLDNRQTGASLHICGAVERLWHYIRTLPLATFSIDNQSNLAEAIHYFQDHFRITGNVPPVEVMYQGKEADVHSAVLACVQACQGDPRKLTLSVGCDIPYKAPLDNLQYYMDAAREYANYETLRRQYPLEWVQAD